MEVISWIIHVLVSVWLLCCPLVCLYWVFKPPEYFWEEHKRISTTIYACGLLAFALIIAAGVDLFLWFIPENWSFETDDGSFDPVRGTIATLLALGITVCLVMLLENACLEKHDEQTEENIKWYIERYKSKLDSDSNEIDREKLKAELKAEKAELDKLNWPNKLTPRQERKLRVLQGLFDESGEDSEQ